jgi:hypothetical protein
MAHYPPFKPRRGVRIRLLCTLIHSRVFRQSLTPLSRNNKHWSTGPNPPGLAFARSQSLGGMLAGTPSNDLSRLAVRCALAGRAGPSLETRFCVGSLSLETRFCVGSLHLSIAISQRGAEQAG